MSDPARRIDDAWSAALEVWGVQTTLSKPERWKKGEGAQADEPLAYIELTTRQVVVNLDMLDRMGAGGSLTAVLAHEIGHHVRFPHQTRMSMLHKPIQRRRGTARGVDGRRTDKDDAVRQIQNRALEKLRASAERVRDFMCQYVGQTPLVKGLGTIRIYHVRRHTD